MEKLVQYFNEHEYNLELYTNALVKVHADEHPEVKPVRELYVRIQKKINDENFDIDHEFKTLRRITKDFVIPDDVCETFAKTYHLLESGEQLYNEEEKA